MQPVINRNSSVCPVVQWIDVKLRALTKIGHPNLDALFLSIVLMAARFALCYQVFVPWQEFEQVFVDAFQPMVVAIFTVPLLCVAVFTVVLL